MKPIIVILLKGIIATTSILVFKRYYYKALCDLRTIKLTYKSALFDRPLLYRLYEPRMAKGVSYPLILSLHSAAERGNDNFRQIDGTASTFLSSHIQRRHPAFVLIPQCPDGTQWVNTSFTKTPYGHYQQSSVPESPEMSMTIAVIQQLIANYPIDTSRIYAGGFSMGGSGTWDIISRYPHIFTAAFVMAGVSDTSTAKTIKHIPVWAFNGELDNIVPPSLNKAMLEAITSAGGQSKLTIYTGVGHYCVHQAMKEPGFVEWLFAQKKQ